jgi:hypothetical protein
MEYSERMHACMQPRQIEDKAKKEPVSASNYDVFENLREEHRQSSSKVSGLLGENGKQWTGMMAFDGISICIHFVKIDSVSSTETQCKLFNADEEKHLLVRVDLRLNRVMALVESLDHGDTAKDLNGKQMKLHNVSIAPSERQSEMTDTSRHANKGRNGIGTRVNALRAVLSRGQRSVRFMLSLRAHPYSICKRAFHRFHETGQRSPPVSLVQR